MDKVAFTKFYALGEDLNLCQWWIQVMLSWFHLRVYDDVFLKSNANVLYTISIA